MSGLHRNPRRGFAPEVITPEGDKPQTGRGQKKIQDGKYKMDDARLYQTRHLHPFYPVPAHSIQSLIQSLIQSWQTAQAKMKGLGRRLLNPTGELFLAA